VGLGADIRRVGNVEVSAAARKVRRVAARRAPGSRPGAILLYHRVAHVDVDPWDLAVTPDRFEGQVEMLAAEFNVLPLSELAERARKRDLPEAAVAVTFDDGYLDNLDVAAPILERLGVPATVFVATAFADAERPYWWDELDALIRVPSPPDQLEVPVADVVRRWPTRTEEERQTALVELQNLLRGAEPLDVRSVIDVVREWAGDRGRDRAPRPMTSDDLRSLTSSGLMEAGAHTRLHRSLGQIGTAQREDEVAGSRDDLAAWLGERPRTFSYPYGDHGGGARRTVRAAGFDLAVSTVFGPVTWLTDRFELPRVWVRDADDPDALERRLRDVLRMGGDG
jgi:peptidoglycan/xylan/chitin deacetylase (PgdA/CDA1 family)